MTSYHKHIDSRGPFLEIFAHRSGHQIHFDVKECERFEVLKKKHGLANGYGDTLGLLKGGNCVNRDLLTNKVNQPRRDVNTLESVNCLYKAGKGCDLPVSEEIF